MELCYDVCELERKLDVYMSEIRKNIISKVNENNAVFADVTSMVKIFSHLEMDVNYKIMVCYQRKSMVTSGRVFAVREDCYLLDQYIDNHIYEFREGQYSPLEVIFCDGTPEGYLETAIFDETILQLGCGFKNPLENFVFNNEKLKQNSNPLIIKPDNWLSKYYIDCYGTKVLLTYKYDYLNSILLCEYRFLNERNIDERDFDKRYISHVPQFNKRFSETKKCCLFKRTEITFRDGDKVFDIIY